MPEVIHIHSIRAVFTNFKLKKSMLSEQDLTYLIPPDLSAIHALQPHYVNLSRNSCPRLTPMTQALGVPSDGCFHPPA